jgi:hypothetical protein
MQVQALTIDQGWRSVLTIVCDSLGIHRKGLSYVDLPTNLMEIPIAIISVICIGVVHLEIITPVTTLIVLNDPMYSWIFMMLNYV